MVHWIWLEAAGRAGFVLGWAVVCFLTLALIADEQAEAQRLRDKLAGIG